MRNINSWKTGCFSPLCAWCLTICLAAFAAFGGEVALENEYVKFIFDPGAGYGLTGIEDKTTQRPLLDRAAQKAGDATLWHAAFCNADFMQVAINNSATCTSTHSITRAKGKQVLTIVWRDIALPDKRTKARVEAKVELADGSKLADFFLSVTSDGPSRFWSASYPIVRGIKDLGDDYLVFPEYWGKIVRDPTKRICDYTLPHPGKFSMQFLAMWGSEKIALTPPVEKGFAVNGWVRGPAEDESGVIMIAADGEAWFKEAHTGPCGKEPFVEMYVTHYPPVETWPLPKDAHAAGAYTIPYPMKLGVFNGTAETACDVYRSWALQQQWASRGKIWSQTGDEWKRIPDYVRDNVFWGKFYHETPKVAAELAWYREFLRVPVMTHYYRYYISKFDDNNPEYLPGDPYFRQGIRDMQAMGVGVMPYICSAVWDMDVESYRRENAISGAALNAGGKPYIWLLADNSPSVWMDPASELWQQKMTEVGDKLIGDYGVDGLYLDVLACAAKLSYNHALHKAHGGNYWGQGNRKLIERLKRSAQKREPGMMLSTEGFCETYIDLLDAFLTLDITRYGWNEMRGYDNFPLLPMVYHDFTINYGSDCSPSLDIDFFAWQLGLTYVWGAQPTYSAMVIKRPEEAPQHSAFLKEIARSFHQAGKKFLTGGRWVQSAVVPELPLGGGAPVAVASAEHKVSVSTMRGKKFTWQGPAVLASAYKAHDGAVGIFLVNISAQEQAATVKVDARKLGVDGSTLWQTWPLDKKRIDTLGGAPKIFTSAIPPRSVQVFEINTKEPVTTPLEETPWHFVSATKDGTFPETVKDGTALWGCEDAPVRNAIARGQNALTILAYADDPRFLVPKKVNTVTQWGIEEGHGKPCAPGDKPFHVLQDTRFAVAGSNAVHADVAYAHGVLYAALASDGACAIQGGVATHFLCYSKEKNVTTVSSSQVQLAGGTYEIAAFDMREIERRLHNFKSTEADAIRKSLKALVEDNTALDRKIAAFTASADAFIAKSPSQLFSAELREAVLTLSRLSGALVQVLRGASMVAEAKNDWLVPARPLPVSARITSARNERLTVSSCNLASVNGAQSPALAITGEGKNVGANLSAEAPLERAFTVRTETDAMVERLAPFVLRLALTDSQNNAYRLCAPLWLNIDRPIMAKASGSVSARPGNTVSVKVNVQNVSPHPIEIRPRVEAPPGWGLAKNGVMPFPLAPFTETNVAFALTVAADERASSRDVECFFDYGAGERYAVHEKVEVNIMPALTPLTESRTGGIAGVENIRCRFMNVMTLYPVQGETVDVEITSAPLISTSAKVEYKILDTDSKVIKQAIVASGSSEKIAFKAASRCYYVFLSCPRIARVKVNSPASGGLLATESSPITLCGGSYSFYFHVPKGAKRFEITGLDGGLSEPAKIEIADAGGTAVFSRNGNWDGVWYGVDVPQGSDNAVWNIRIVPVEDIALQLRGDVTPCLSVSKESALKLEK